MLLIFSFKVVKHLILGGKKKPFDEDVQDDRNNELHATSVPPVILSFRKKY